MVGLKLSNAAFLSRVGAVYDVDAQAIITTVEIADGQTLEPTVRNAMNAFVVGCKSDEIWTALSSGVFRLLAGPRTLSGAFAYGVGVSPTNIGFVAGDYSRSLGLTGNGASKYLNSNRACNADVPTNHHISAYAKRLNNNASQILMGSRPTGIDTGGKFLGHRISSSATQFASTPNANSNQSGSIVNLNATTFHGLRRSNSSNYISRNSGENITHTRASADTAHTGNIFIFALNNGETPAVFSNAQISFYSIGSDLGTNGLALLDARVAAYMSAIAGI